MGINQRPGPGESVYRTKLGGEAAGEDDVEGHGFRMAASDDANDTNDTEELAMPNRAPRAGDEDDVEGHGFKASASRRAGAADDEDTEGHGFRASAQPRADDDEDTEGHGYSRS